ncbi:hypothetical protein GBAR_LOCUS18035 [Geodia barretti]|uniref:Uncharacterized protein n=1 Tax=Geodia barretti TaxID=519541 RepID=A0AA35WS55_GEOBA|nr:hypothetical protein GBAR_LOCUS18035 [Geodia barretti]
MFQQIRFYICEQPEKNLALGVPYCHLPWFTLSSLRGTGMMVSVPFTAGRQQNVTFLRVLLGDLFHHNITCSSTAVSGGTRHSSTPLILFPLLRFII